MKTRSFGIALVAGVLYLLAVTDATAGCASGFMELEVLRKRAEKIPSGSPSPNVLDNEFRLIPDWNFTCNGSITSLLLGVDIQVGQSDYPQVQIWRRNGFVSDQFNKVDSREIRLVAGNFTPSGVFQYKLIPPMQFQSGDVLGIFQPPQEDSLVRLYYNSNDGSAPVAYRLGNNPSTVNIIINSTGISITTGEYILLSLITDSPSCTSGILSSDALRQKTLDVNIYGVTRRNRQQRIFPDIHFTCSGNLTKWIVGGEIRINVGAELQIWRRSNVGENNYTKVGSSVLQATDPDNDLVNEYIPNPPLEFQEGDILGVYQSQKNRIRVYYQETTGPENYRRPGDLYIDPPAPDTLTGATLVTNGYDYPLVTVEIVTPTSSVTTVMITPSLPAVSTEVTPTSSVTTVMMTPSVPAVSTEGVIVSSSTAARISTDVIEQLVSITPLQIVTSYSQVSPALTNFSLLPSNSLSLNIIIIGVPVAVVVFLVTAITCTIVIIMIVIWKRRKYKYQTQELKIKKEYDTPNVTDQNVAYQKHIELQDNECYATSTRNERTEDGPGNYSCISVDVQHTDSPIDVEQNVAYHKHIELQDNVCYTTSFRKETEDGSDHDAYAYIPVDVQHTIPAQAPAMMLTMEENVAHEDTIYY